MILRRSIKDINKKQNKNKSSLFSRIFSTKKNTDGKKTTKIRFRVIQRMLYIMLVLKMLVMLETRNASIMVYK